MAENHLTVMVASAQDSSWHQFGIQSHDTGIYPEDFQLKSVLPGGVDEFSFTLKRSSRINWPDLMVMSPVEVWIGNTKVATGRIREVPATTDDTFEITVVCDGGFHYLEDEVVKKTWVHNDMRAWKDIRTFDGSDDDYTTKRGKLSKDANKGIISIGWAKGDSIDADESVGVMIDLGRDADKRMGQVDVRLTYTGAHANYSLFIRTADHMGSGGTAPLSGNLQSNSTTLGGGAGANDILLSNTFGSLPDSRSRRYISVFVKNSSGGTLGPLSSDLTFKIKQIQMYRSTTYQTTSSGASVSTLKATDVVKDIVQNGQPLVDAKFTTDTPAGYITPSTYAIPQSDTGGYKSVRDILDTVNSYDGADWWVDEYMRLHWTQTASVPSWTTYLSRGAHLSTSGDSGQDLYNRVIVSGQDQTGSPVVVSNVYANPTFNSSAPQPTNPGFETNTVGWTALNGTGTRQTATFDTGVASYQINFAAGTPKTIDVYTDSWTTINRGFGQFSFIEGELYRVTLRIRPANNFATNILSAQIYVTDSLQDQSLSNGYTSDQYSTGDTINTLNLGTWQTFTREFVADSNYQKYQLHIVWTSNTSSVNGFYLDTVSVERANTGVLGFQNTRRTALIQVSGNINDADANQIGKKFLSYHGPYPPLRGSITVAGTGMVTDAQSGETVAPYRIRPGDVILIGDLPTRSSTTSAGATYASGAIGRSAKVVGVTYDHNSRAATLDLDNSRDWVFTLNNRLRNMVVGAN